MSIIKRTMTVDGKVTVFYHQKLELTKRPDVMNAYTETVTAKKKEALVFNDNEEAEKMAEYLNKAHTAIVDKAEVIYR